MFTDNYCNQMFWQVMLPFDVLLTSYDIALMDKDFLSQIPWQYAIIDEAQRLKNPSSVCRK
jgi:chromodomain-helicase-DNA-binding protein 1-like